jgi:hypothetical protein
VDRDCYCAYADCIGRRLEPSAVETGWAYDHPVRGSATTIALAVAAAACSMNASFDGAYLCPDERCPPGYTCQDGVCRTGQPAADAAPADGAGEPEPITALIGERADELQDTELWQAFSDRNYGASDHISVDSGEVSLVRFDLSALPAEAAVLSAVLSVTTASDSGAEGGTVQVHRVLEAWDEGSSYDAQGAASWQERQAGAPWAVAGAAPPSRDGIVLALMEFEQDGADTTYSTELPAAVVEAWLRDPKDNHGIVLTPGTLQGHLHLRSREAASGWSTLTVQYEP